MNNQRLTEARLDLAEELANLAEALRDPATGEDMIEALDKKGEIRLFSVLGKDKTIAVIRKWSDEELQKLKDDYEDEWPEIFYDA